MKKNQTGFSLIEVVIVLVILGVLASILLPTLFSQKRIHNKENALNFMQDIAGYCNDAFRCEVPEGRRVPDDYKFDIDFQNEKSFTITAVPLNEEHIGEWYSPADDAITLIQRNGKKTILVRRMSAVPPKLKDTGTEGVYTVGF